ncbi:MAG: STT3 domain-containing protein [Candidatus Thermoplasmatota archaeon]
MRKRAQRRSAPPSKKSKSTSRKTKLSRLKSFNINKKWLLAISLIGIFCLVLILNTYFNYASGISAMPDGEGLSKFLLSGPDPYYNMRLVDETVETGTYPYYTQDDPILNYPLGRSGDRGPLFNMLSIGFSKTLTPFMDNVSALGLSMQLIPAILGALLVFPVYHIGKNLFNKKAGLIAALLVPLIPVHIGAGHGSAFTLFDHDSFNILMFFSTYAFLISGIIEKDKIKSYLYAIAAGIPLAALTMTWVEAEFLFAVIGLYAVVQLIIDVFTSRIEKNSFLIPFLTLLTGYLISLPVLSADGFAPSLHLYITLIVGLFGVIYYLFRVKNIPWTLSLPGIFVLAGIGLAFLYFIEDISAVIPFFSRFEKLSEIIYGAGIYGKKVSLTIAEANTFGISKTAMSFGPALFWVGWIGFFLVAYQYYKEKLRREYLFIMVIFLIEIWLIGTAGRFINDLVPLVALLSGWIIYRIINYIDYEEMIKNVKRAGGGFYGLKRGVKLIHLLGVLFIVFLVVAPNSLIAFDAAIPSEEKRDVFGEDWEGAYGLSLYKSEYWADAFEWLNDQDTEVEEPEERPAFIAWWDYGFYEAAIGEHPTVADNFQDGIPPAANFHTATSEKAGVGIWIVRLLEGYVTENNGVLPADAENVLKEYIGEDDTKKVKKWLEEPTTAPSYDKPIDEKYHEDIRDIDKRFLKVGAQWPENAVYIDTVDLLTDYAKTKQVTQENKTVDKTVGLNDEEITSLYRDIQDVTGKSIRYYGVEGYDRKIFNIFAFLSDKSLLMLGAPKDEYVEVYYKGHKVDERGNKVPNTDFTKSAEKILNMSEKERRFLRVTDSNQRYLDPFFNTMFYKTYIGVPPRTSGGARGAIGGQTNQQQKTIPRYHIPCYNMKHFYAEFVSNASKYPSPYSRGMGSVVIAKYYEGARINGSVSFMDKPLSGNVVVMKNASVLGQTFPVPHDSYNMSEEGNFSVIAGAGNMTVQVRRYPELGANAFPVKNITFNKKEDPVLSPITKEEARRTTENFTRTLNVTVEPANIKGYVYENKDQNESFSKKNDTGVENVNLTLLGAEKLSRGNRGRIQIQKYDYTMFKEDTTDEEGLYNLSNLKPGYFAVIATIDDFYIHRTLTTFHSGNKSYNITKPKSSAIKGIIYHDANQNGKYDDNEALNGANVDLLHKTGNNEKILNTTTTGPDGKYSFKGLIPGKINGDTLNQYIVNVSKLPQYHSKKTVYPTENKTTTLNISIGLANVTVEGFTSYNGENINNITVKFNPDETVEDNNAKTPESQPVTNEEGRFSVELKPGSYNVTVNKRSKEVLVYSAKTKITLYKNESVRSGVQIELNKKSATVSGTTSYQGEDLANITINFIPDENKENNQATFVPAKSDEEGFYQVELKPGSYNVSASSGNLKEGDQTYSYIFTGYLQVTEADIPEGIKYDINLSYREKE